METGETQCERKETAKQVLRKLFLLIPNLLKLLGRLIKDPRVPKEQKVILLGVIVYVASPIDLVPDWLPVLGQADDILLIAFALDLIMNEVDPEIVREHWDGEQEILEVIQTILRTATFFVPASIKQKLLGKVGR